jgi:hypothetical protein
MTFTDAYWKSSLAINAFFTTWNSALVAATLDASLISTELITAVDPQKKTHFSLAMLFTALAVGLAFLVAPEIAPEALIAVTTAETLGVSAGTATAGLSAAGHALVVGLQQAPGVAKTMWPEGTSNVSRNQSTIRGKRNEREADYVPDSNCSNWRHSVGTCE